VEMQIPMLLNDVKNVGKPPHARLAALDELSSVLVSGRRDSDLSTAVIAQGWSGSSDDMNDDAPLKYLTEHLEGEVLPVLGQVMMDRDFYVANRAALVLARAGAALGSDAEPFFHWAVKGIETQAVQDPVRLSIHLSVVSIALQLGQRDCMKPLVSQLLTRLSSLLETVSHYQMVTPLVQTIQVIAGLFAEDFESIMCDVVDLLVGWSLDPDVPESARLTITGTFANFKHLWHGHLPFADSLLRKLLSDMEALANLALSSLAAPISSSSGASGLAVAAGASGNGGDGSDDAEGARRAAGVGAGQGAGGRRGGAAEVERACAELQRLALCFVGIVEGVGEELGAEEEEAMLRRYLHCVCGTVISLRTLCGNRESDAHGGARGSAGSAGRGGRGGGRGGKVDKGGANKERFTLEAWVGLARGAERRIMHLMVALLRRHSPRASLHAARAAQNVRQLLAAILAAITAPSPPARPGALPASGLALGWAPLVGAVDDISDAVLAAAAATREMIRYADAAGGGDAVGGRAAGMGMGAGPAAGAAGHRETTRVVFEAAKLLLTPARGSRLRGAGVSGGESGEVGMRSESAPEECLLSKLRLHEDVQVALAARRLYAVLLRNGMPDLSVSPAADTSGQNDGDAGHGAGSLPRASGSQSLAATSADGAAEGAAEGAEEGDARDRLAVAGLLLSELECVCGDIGSRNEALVWQAQRGCVDVDRGADREQGDDSSSPAHTGAPLANSIPTSRKAPPEACVSWAASESAIGEMRRLEVLGVFLSGVLLEGFREVAAGRMAQIERRKDDAWEQDGALAGGTCLAVDILDLVVTSAEHVATPGPQALPVSALKECLTRLLAATHSLFVLAPALPSGRGQLRGGGAGSTPGRVLATVRRRAAAVLLKSLRPEAATALKIAINDAVVSCAAAAHGCSGGEAGYLRAFAQRAHCNRSLGGVGRGADLPHARATARHLCDAALLLASDADPRIRAVSAASVQAGILLAVLAGLPAKALVVLRAALSRLADTSPVPSQPSSLGGPQQPLLGATVGAQYLAIIGRVSHVLLLYPVRTLSSKIVLDSPGEELGVPGWLRLLVSGKAGAGSPVTPLRSVDLQVSTRALHDPIHDPQKSFASPVKERHSTCKEP